MNSDLIVFLVLSLIAVASALGMMFSRNAVYSALFLVLNFITVAVFYLLLGAPFIAMSQITVYAGAIMVLFLFVLMLLNLNKDTEPQKSTTWKFSGAIAAGMLLVTILGALRGGIQLQVPENASGRVGLVENLGKVLFTDFVVPFEIAGILFLAAMVGAVLVGKRDLQV